MYKEKQEEPRYTTQYLRVKQCYECDGSLAYSSNIGCNEYVATGKKICVYRMVINNDLLKLKNNEGHLTFGDLEQIIKEK